MLGSEVGKVLAAKLRGAAPQPAPGQSASRKEAKAVAGTAHATEKAILLTYIADLGVGPGENGLDISRQSVGYLIRAAMNQGQRLQAESDVARRVPMPQSLPSAAIRPSPRPAHKTAVHGKEKVYGSIP